MRHWLNNENNICIMEVSNNFKYASKLIETVIFLITFKHTVMLPHQLQLWIKNKLISITSILYSKASSQNKSDYDFNGRFGCDK